MLYVVYNICTYIIYIPRQAHCLKTKAGRKMSATAIIIRQDSASIFTFSSLRDSADIGPTSRQRRPPLAISLQALTRSHCQPEAADLDPEPRTVRVRTPGEPESRVTVTESP